MEREKERRGEIGRRGTGRERGEAGCYVMRIQLRLGAWVGRVSDVLGLIFS